jgi:hypothetical protein
VPVVEPRDFKGLKEMPGFYADIKAQKTGTSHKKHAIQEAGSFLQ